MFNPFFVPSGISAMTPTELLWLRLHLTRGLGRAGIFRLMKTFGSPEAALRVGPQTWWEKAGVRRVAADAVPPEQDARLRQAWKKLTNMGVRIVSFWDEEHYPPALRSIFDPPALLYVRGTLPPGEALAVVGSRQASPNGLQLTQDICREIAARGIVIVSGLARGIDSAAHEGALQADGHTVAVLGCGIDRIYPPENSRLFLRILDKGAILSEYPPGTPPMAGHFPGRNRIISGLCRGVLVVEAAARSGSLITADFALDQGREVFAIPGPVRDAGSQGVNRLLKDGACLVTESADILQALWPHLPSPCERQQEDALAGTLSPDALQVYRQVGNEPLHVDDLVRKCALTPMEVSAILLHLELANGVEQLPGMRYVRKRNPRANGGL
jgi:DNA processing protein